MLKPLFNFVTAKWRSRAEEKGRGEAQLALGETSLTYWEDRLGWSPSAARYLASAFTFGVRENIAEVLQKAQQLHESTNFEEQFVNRTIEDPSIIGATLDASRFTTSDDLRDLLSRILANDVNRPGSISKRTVSIAEDLSSEDLQRFLKLRSVAWRIPGEYDEGGYILVMGKQSAIYGEEFLSFNSDEIGVPYYYLGELEQLGLIQERVGGATFQVTGDEGEYVKLAYGDRVISVRPTEKKQLLRTGVHILTLAGNDILSLFMDREFAAREGYFEEVCERWRSDGLEIVELSE